VFTGIVSAIGKISSIKKLEDGLRLSISLAAKWLDDVSIGDSISHNGVCLTVTAKKGKNYQVEVSGETLKYTTGLDQKGKLINLEKALRLSDLIGGHLVTGHVDGVGVVVSFEDKGESKNLVIKLPKPLMGLVAKKGSLAVDGVSLTVNRLRGRRVSINLISHTLLHTNLSDLRSGSKVNLEVDLLARYAQRLLATGMIKVK